MLAPAGYTLLRTLRSTSKSEVCLARRDADGCEVILKSYVSSALATNRGSRAERELEALRVLAGDGVPRGIELVRTASDPILVLERAPGVGLAEWVESRRLGAEAWLEVALQLAEILVRVHAARWIHRDLTPDNVLVEPRALRAYLIDFGIARRLGAAAHAHGASEPDECAGTFAFMAPEQTGRMNRGVDARSDLYGLGSTLYYALVGRTPFEETDPLALINAHMAIVPRPPSELRPDLPEILSRIVQKLLEKEPDDRYQSARALAADLRLCREQIAQRGQVDASFQLGTSEAPDRPRFVPKLYGREAQTARLYALYERATSGVVQVLMLAGAPGVGKSMLVDELPKQLGETGGYLAIGKFDPSHDRPYAAWSAALGQFAQQLLVESDTRLEAWRQAIRTGLGNVAAALLDLVPDLAFILGEVPPIPALGPRETQARLSLALQRLIGVCAAREHPLVIFLDNLQWSDAASRFLLEDLLSSAQPSALLLIGAYRASDVGQAHPLSQLFATLAARSVALEFMELGPLSREATVQMLADALERRPDAVHPLAELIERKTGNAPLFVREFVEHIHARGLLSYEDGSGWSWDPEAIAAADIPDGAVALMSARLQGVGEEPRSVLQLASCVGDEFDVDLLAEVSGREKAGLERSLFALSDAGLIVPCPNGFRFVHDRIRETAQLLLSNDARAQLHYEMARLLLARIPEAEQPQRATEIAGHLNRGLVYVPEQLRITAIRLNVMAGKKALAAGAAATAEVHLATARRLFHADDWPAEAALGFDVFLQSAESAFLNRDFERALGWLDTLEQRPISLRDFAKIAAKRIQVFALTKSPDECALYMLVALRRFGLRWPLHPSRLRVQLALRRVAWRLRRCEKPGFLRPLSSNDPRRVGALLLIRVGGGVMLRVDIHLAALASCWSLLSIAKVGYISGPGFSLSSYAMWLQLILGDTARALQLEQVARKWNQQAPHPAYGPRAEFGSTIGLLLWTSARRKTLSSLDRVGDELREVGEVEHNYYARFLRAVYRTLAGDRLADALKALQDLAEAVRRAAYQYPEPERCYLVLRAFCAARGSGSLAADVGKSDDWLAANPGSVETYVRTLWMMLLCVEGQFDLAFAQSEKLGARLMRVVPYVHVADHTFYRGLAAAGLATAQKGSARRRLRRALDASLRHMQRWAKHGPDFRHMAMILGAERMRLRGQGRQALLLYERAAGAARECEFQHHAALALERRARTFIELRRTAEGRMALAAAGARYQEWGATAKATALEQECKQMMNQRVLAL